MLSTPAAATVHSFRIGRPWLTGVVVVGLAWSATNSPAQSEAPNGPRPDTDVVASYTTGQITRADMEDVIAHRHPAQQRRIAAPGGRESVFEELLRYDLLAQEAEKRGYATHLAVSQAVKRKATERMLDELKAVDPRKVAAADVARAFEQRKAEFSRAEMRRASHIQFADENAAKALRARIKPGDRNAFAKLAVEHSEDPRTQRQAGELGYFDAEGHVDGGRPGDVLPAIVRTTFQLKLGEVSQPIAHDGVFSLIMFTGEMPPVKTSLAALEPQLRAELAEAQEKKQVDAYVEELREQYEPEIHAELIDAVVVPTNIPLDRPEGFAVAPTDPRVPPQTVQPDGI